MEMKLVRIYILKTPDSESPKPAVEGMVNTMHIKRIVEQPASDDDKISFGLKFKNKKMLDRVCELQCVNDICLRVPYTKAEFMKMYENT
jgi:hypothetical protein